jgi:hypothetical protein
VRWSRSWSSPSRRQRAGELPGASSVPTRDSMRASTTSLRAGCYLVVNVSKSQGHIRARELRIFESVSAEIGLLVRVPSGAKAYLERRCPRHRPCEVAARILNCTSCSGGRFSKWTSTTCRTRGSSEASNCLGKRSARRFGKSLNDDELRNRVGRRTSEIASVILRDTTSYTIFNR